MPAALDKSLFSALLLLLASAAQSFVGGSGTAEQPYKISTPQHLEAVNQDLSAHYVLINDIDLASQSYEKAVIAAYMNTGSSPFEGVFDGRGFSVKNLTINGNSDMCIALFGRSHGGTIKNLGVENCNVSGWWFVGALVGQSRNSTIINCFGNGIVTGSGSYIGGLIGDSSGCYISNSYASAAVTADCCGGGLIGFVLGSEISNSFAIGSITAQKAGGLIGYCGSSIISNCYAAAAITPESSGGGLIADSEESVVSNSFWDVLISGKTQSSGGYPKGTAQMKNIDTFLSAGWDFVNEDINGQMYLWYMPEDDYPHLYWQAEIGDFNYDGQLDLLDLHIMAFEWLSLPQENQRLICDINQDGVVDLLDLAAFANQWRVE